MAEKGGRRADGNGKGKLRNCPLSVCFPRPHGLTATANQPRFRQPANRQPQVMGLGPWTMDRQWDSLTTLRFSHAPDAWS